MMGVRTAMFRAVALAAVAFIVIASLVPAPSRPHVGVPGELEHFAAYLLTGYACGMGWPSRADRLRSALALIALAGLLEFLQLWVPGRHCEVIAALISGAGAAIGVMCAALIAAVQQPIRALALPLSRPRWPARRVKVRAQILM